MTGELTSAHAHTLKAAVNRMELPEADCTKQVFLVVHLRGGIKHPTELLQLSSQNLSLHTHTHTHTLSISLSPPVSLSLSLPMSLTLVSLSDYFYSAFSPLHLSVS